MSVLSRMRVHLRRLTRAAGDDVVESTRFMAGVAAIWFGMTSVAFAVFYIPSESMQPTLEVGDRIYVSKWAYGYSRHSLPLGMGDMLPDSWDGRIGWAAPDRGDVIVLRHPRNGLVLIKRVVGLPGDVVEVRRGVLVLNGEPVSRDFVETRTYREHDGFPVVEVAHYRETLPGGAEYSIYERSDRDRLDDFGPVTIPNGHVFLMGDNRDNSVDSRDTRGPGFVPLSHVIGRAETVPFTLERCRREDGLYCPEGRVWRGL